MTNFWLLPFGLIGYWFAAGTVELMRTPNPPRDVDNGMPMRPQTN